MTDHLAETPDLAALSGLKAADYRAWMAARRRGGLSARSLARELSAVRGFFRYVQRRWGIDAPGLLVVEGPKLPRSKPKPVSEDAAARLLDEAGHRGGEAWVEARDAALVALLYGCGLRLSEALSLTGADTPLPQSLRITGKGNKTRIVPVLLVLALILVIAGPRIQAYARRRAEAAGRAPGHVSTARMAALVVGTFAVGVYGGYFTAAQGILFIGVMGALLPEDVQRMNAAKNLLSLLVNVVAATAYTLVAFDRISWPAAGLIAIGSLVGGWLGARYGRRLSPAALRTVIVVVGLIGLYRLLTV